MIKFSKFFCRLYLTKDKCFRFSNKQHIDAKFIVKVSEGDFLFDSDLKVTVLKKKNDEEVSSVT